MLKVLARFVFENVAALGPQEDITCQGLNEVYIRLWRSFRTTPFPHQPQKALNGAVLGAEVMLRVTYRGRPAAGFRWELRRGKRLIQRGHVDGEGICGDVHVDLPYGDCVVYELRVAAPARPRRAPS
jgi:hypothetical protein